MSTAMQSGMTSVQHTIVAFAGYIDGDGLVNFYGLAEKSGADTGNPDEAHSMFVTRPGSSDCYDVTGLMFGPKRLSCNVCGDRYGLFDLWFANDLSSLDSSAGSLPLMPLNPEHFNVTIAGETMMVTPLTVKVPAVLLERFHADLAASLRDTWMESCIIGMKFGEGRSHLYDVTRTVEQLAVFLDSGMELTYETRDVPMWCLGMLDYYARRSRVRFQHSTIQTVTHVLKLSAPLQRLGRHLLNAAGMPLVG